MGINSVCDTIQLDSGRQLVLGFGEKRLRMWLCTVPMTCVHKNYSFYNFTATAKMLLIPGCFDRRWLEVRSWFWLFCTSGNFLLKLCDVRFIGQDIIASFTCSSAAQRDLMFINLTLGWGGRRLAAHPPNEGEVKALKELTGTSSWDIHTSLQLSPYYQDEPLNLNGKLINIISFFKSSDLYVHSNQHTPLITSHLSTNWAPISPQWKSYSSRSGQLQNSLFSWGC